MDKKIERTTPQAVTPTRGAQPHKRSPAKIILEKACHKWWLLRGPLFHLETSVVFYTEVHYIILCTCLWKCMLKS